MARHTKPYPPRRDADFDLWLLNLNNYVVAKTTGTPQTWTHIPPEKVTALRGSYTAWHTAFEACIGPHTAVETKAKNDLKAAAVSFIRPFVNQYLRYDPVSNEDRVAMGIPNRDTTHTSIGAPTTRPVITELKALGGFQVRISFRDEPTPDSRALPYGMNGCLLNFTYGSSKVLEYAGLTQTKLLTRSPETISLPPEAEAAHFSCALRWQNERGEIGPWSEIQIVVVA